MLKETFKNMFSEKYQVTKADIFYSAALVIIFLAAAHLEVIL
jgi:hypothetical protein